MEEQFLQQMKAMLGEETEVYLAALRQPAVRGLRVNTAKISVDDFLKRFPVELRPNAFCPSGFSVPAEAAGFGFGDFADHRAGLYYMQEPSATIAAEALIPHLGKRVLDLCAAPGGKTTQLAAALPSDGVLVANEIRFSRARILQSNVERMGIRNAAVTCNAPEDLARRFAGWFDAVLVDAPCSGEGMFRKSDNAVRDWSPEGVRACAERQAGILDCAAECVAVGGFLLYSTCTLNEVENEGTVRQFLTRHPEWELVRVNEPLRSLCRPGFGLPEAIRVFPHQAESGGEGHFACLMQKTGAPSERECRAPGRESPRERQRAGNSRAAEEAFSCYTSEAPFGVFRQSGEYWQIVPEEMPSLRGLSVLSCGVAAFREGAGRLEPCHALALALDPGRIRNRRDFRREDPALSAYFRGESLTDPGDGSGFTVICAEGYPVGWAKSAGGVLKNHYPKGLRRTAGQRDPLSGEPEAKSSDRS